MNWKKDDEFPHPMLAGGASDQVSARTADLNSVGSVGVHAVKSKLGRGNRRVCMTSLTLFLGLSQSMPVLYAQVNQPQTAQLADSAPMSSLESNDAQDAEMCPATGATGSRSPFSMPARLVSDKNPVQQRGSAAGQAAQLGVRATAILSTPAQTSETDLPLSDLVPLNRRERDEEENNRVREWLRSQGFVGTPNSQKPRVGPGASTNESPGTLAPTLGVSFQGGTQIGRFPSDCALAAGPTSLVAVTNDFVNTFDKNGNAIQAQLLQQFFSPLGQPATDGNGPFDPHVVYDEYIERFWLIAVSKDLTASPTRSTLLIALSDTNNAAGGWTLFAMNAKLNGNSDSGYWCDFPLIGVDAQAIYLTCNMFDNSNDSQYSKIRVMTKDQFLNNAGLFWWDFWNLRESELGIQASYTIQPAHMYGAAVADGEFLIDSHLFCIFCPPDTLEVWHLTNAQRCCTPGSQSSPDLDQESHDVGEFPDPPGARQSGTTTRIDTGDTRLLYAFWKDGRLSTGQNLGCDGNACVAFTELDVSDYPDISTVNDLAYTANGVDYYYPAVEVNGVGNKTMVFARSSPTEFAGIRYVGIPPSSTCTNCIDGPEVLPCAAGAGCDGLNTYINTGCPQDRCPASGDRNRWGDYFGAAADPDGTGIWIHGPFASGTGSRMCGPTCAVTQRDTWATQVALTQETSSGRCGNGPREAIEQCDDGNLVTGDGCEADCTYTQVCQAVGAGGTVTTDISVSGATADFPMQVSLTTPGAGTICIAMQTPGPAPAPGFTVLGLQAQITAPPASPGSPLILVFLIDASQIPAGDDQNSITVFKNGASVPACTGAVGVANPDPCISERALLTDGDVRITVLTSTASLWTLIAPTTVGSADLSVSKYGSPGTVLTGQYVTWTVPMANGGPDAALAPSVTDHLAPTTTFSSVNVPGGWTCSTPTAGSTGTVSCSELVMTAGESVSLDIVVNVDCAVPQGTLIENSVSLTSAADTPDPETDNNAASASVIASNPPPVIQDFRVLPDTLWPPNHKWVNAQALYTVTDNCGTPACSLTVSSNEPVNGTGDGDVAPDWIVLDDHSLQLRSERAGTGTGRLYTVAVQCTDSGGGAASALATVTVPHDRSGRANAGSGLNGTGTGFLPTAEVYKLIVLSTQDLDIRQIVPESVQVGGLMGVLNATLITMQDVNCDGERDMVATFPTDETLDLMLTSPDPPALRYETQDGTGYLVLDIFKLGSPLASSGCN